MNLAVRFRFHHAERMPQAGAFVLAPNHYSEIDPVVMGVVCWKLGRAPRFLAKASLFKNPVLAWFLRTSGQIPVERAGSKSHAALRAAEELVEKGRMVVVYPEGSLTRDPDLWPMRGKTGAVRIALEQDIPIIPAAHWGTQALLAALRQEAQPLPAQDDRRRDRGAAGPQRVSRQAARPGDPPEGHRRPHERDRGAPSRASRRARAARALGPRGARPEGDRSP